MAAINSYAGANAFLSKARNKDNGRPLGNSYRIRKQGDDIVVSHTKSVDVFILHKDNTATFCAHLSYIPMLGYIGRYTPFAFGRRGKDRYGVWCDMRQGVRWEDRPEYFVGMRFDLNTGVCLNDQGSIIAKENIDMMRRKLWLSDLRKFKLSIRTMARLGVFSATLSQMSRERARYRALTAELVVDAMQNGITTEFTQAACRNVLWHNRDNPLDQNILDLILTRLNTDSLELRKLYGVFKSHAELPKTTNNKAQVAS